MNFTKIPADQISLLLPESHQLHISLLDFWNDLRGSRQFPSHDDIHPEDMLPWLGRFNLIDVLKPLDFRYRLYGSKLRDDSHYDLTGRCLSELTVEQREVVETTYANVIRSGNPMFTLVEPTEPTREFMVFSRLILPFSNTQKDVDLLLVFILRMSLGEVNKHRDQLPLFHEISISN